MTETGKRDFNQAAKTWDDNPMRVELARAIADAILRQVPVSEGMDAMDYGAGTGLVTLALQPHVRSITAVDSSEGMLTMLGEKIVASGLGNVKTMLLDLESDPMPEQRFDLIISSMTMHHIEDVSALIRSFHRMLRVGGYLAIADLDLDGGEFHSDPTGVKHNGFDRDEVESILADSELNHVVTATAHTFLKEVNRKGERQFSVFLVTGRKTQPDRQALWTRKQSETVVTPDIDSAL